MKNYILWFDSITNIQVIAMLRALNVIKQESQPVAYANIAGFIVNLLHLAFDPLHKFINCAVAQLLQVPVVCRCLDQASYVTPRLKLNLHMRYLNAEVFCKLRRYIQLIVEGIVLPRYQLNIKHNPSLVLKRLAAILTYNIDQSDTS